MQVDFLVPIQAYPFAFTYWQMRIAILGETESEAFLAWITCYVSNAVMNYRNNYMKYLQYIYVYYDTYISRSHSSNIILKV